MTHTQRLETLRILVNQNALLAGAPEKPDIDTEWENLLRLEPGTDDDERLLTVIHTTRLIDTCLQVIVYGKGWGVPINNRTPNSIGQYLYRLHIPAQKITPRQRTFYIQKVADERNHFMHKAGATPDATRVGDLLTHMHNCMALILSLV